MGKRPERQIALLAKLDIAFGYGPKGRGFESLTARHVGASSAYITPSKGWGICLLPLLLLFRKKSRSAPLLGCKRPRDGSLSLPTFCGLLLKQISILSKVSTSRWIFAFHNPLGKPSGFSNRFITAPHSAKKPVDAPAIRLQARE